MALATTVTISVPAVLRTYCDGASELSLPAGSVRAALERLSGRVSADDMRAMNYAADVEHQDVVQIVRAFLARR